MAELDISTATIFFFPFAGGSKYSYRAFEQSLSKEVRIITFDYPGRGSRVSEPLINSIDLLVDDVYEQFKKYDVSKPYAFFGHSMGALIAYLLLRRIRADSRTVPVHLFLSGTSGPSAVSRKKNKKHKLSTGDFFSEIQTLGSPFSQVFESLEFANYFEPILRNDFKVSEDYLYFPDVPFDIHFTVMTGKLEDLEPEDITLWQRESSKVVDFCVYDGNHFFIFDHVSEISLLIENTILSCSEQ